MFRLLSAYRKFIVLQFGGGGDESSSTTATTTVPEKTKTEKAVEALTLAQLQRQEDQAAQYDPIIQQYLRDVQEEQAARKTSGVTVADRVAQEKVSFERANRMAAVEEELSNLQLEQIKSGGKATPEQIALINEATGAAQKTGEADIERFRLGTLRQINEEVAGASGLRGTDTPILRLSERAGEEASRQQGVLTSRLAETNAAARLNFPLSSTKITSDIAAGQQSLQMATEQFQAQLRQRAEDNRFRLFQSSPTNQFTLSPSGFGAMLANERFRGVTSTSTTNKEGGSGSSIGQVGQLAGGVGGLIGAFI